MTLMTDLNLTYPIIQAPMAGGATTPELIAAVSNFGGLGSLGAGMTAPDVLNTQIKQIKALTDKPFAVNLMVLSEDESSTLDTPIQHGCKPARGLVNDYLTTYAQYDNTNLPQYPQLNAMTKPMRAHAGKQGHSDYLSLWAGQGVSQVKEESVVYLMQRLVANL